MKIKQVNDEMLTDEEIDNLIIIDKKKIIKLQEEVIENWDLLIKELESRLV